MKKILVVIISIILLTACYKENNNSLYNELVEELKSVNSSSEDIPLDIEIEIEKFNDSLYRYSALINKGEESIKEGYALLIHNKKSENAFPSIGIFDDKVSLNNEKGIKLSGYVEDIENIEFKLLINYINKDKNEVKYYYVEDISTINVKEDS